MFREGFWRPVEATTSQLPIPLAREVAWKGQREFLAALSAMERRATLIDHHATEECHFCDTALTRAEFWILGQWKWAMGLYHYVQAHHVRPSLGFQEFVLGRELK